MLLTITLIDSAPSDLGFLLHKHPDRLQTFSLSFGKAHIFYPLLSEEQSQVALLLDLDPIGLVRGRKKVKGESPTLGHYVNDRPYVASSFMSSAIAKVFGSALNGRSKERAGRVQEKLRLEAMLSVVSSRGGEVFLRKLFEPLGYEIDVKDAMLDDQFPEWGKSGYYRVTLKNHCSLQTLLSHLYVLLPVLDRDKHYWIGEDEKEKLLKHGASWLIDHPEQQVITARYLGNRTKLVKAALARLADEEQEDTSHTSHLERKEKSLNQQRYESVTKVLVEKRAERVLDLGCGEGKLLQYMLREPTITELVGMDVSPIVLERAKSRLCLDGQVDGKGQRIRLVQGSLLYADKRLVGFDAATVVEVIEHLDEARLQAFERACFAFAQPKTVIVTTPNAEYNKLFANLPHGKFRHGDHRFEWTRAQFSKWSQQVADTFGYEVLSHPIGPVDEEVGSPTQMAVFTKKIAKREKWRGSEQ
ncbi:3' terminal RNA ribose 2'-O-methyltransferase Hen1 [Mechercharimyces sp. CAU 1602]|uniref:3' terminal RNA ribose 2'-O-methyltransferase Hen1 n=1 Tax=Mechercharimyces sp. CAU 1602 TaxID=2973933 RepID=UPI002162B7B5|nr:3' terminal RNA ribose 2'-O-methyltransferase Hen1 [Mechercharimyces sp. CAU 1602]MCS1350413.1 3' terminal RNA ribose 2'-O-methyltransferase Hen1 [Mechercharimyces sp. CAU 1602]